MSTILQMRRLLKEVSNLPKVTGLIKHEAVFPGQISLTPNLVFSTVSFPISLQGAWLGDSDVRSSRHAEWNESNFRRGQTQGLKNHLKMAPWWEAKDRANSPLPFSLLPLCLMQILQYIQKGFLIEYIQTVKKYKNLYLHNFLNVTSNNFSSKEFIHTKHFFILKGTNPYKMDLPIHATYCQSFVF